jgi:hypothetical protein
MRKMWQSVRTWSLTILFASFCAFLSLLPIKWEPKER